MINTCLSAYSTFWAQNSARLFYYLVTIHRLQSSVDCQSEGVIV